MLVNHRMRHDDLNTVTSKNSKSTEINKLYIETLQPITHYDENAKSVVFVQGRIGRSGEKISSYKLDGYLGASQTCRDVYNT